MSDLKIQVNAKGPLLIKGGATLVHEDGTEEEKKGLKSLVTRRKEEGLVQLVRSAARV